MKTMDYMLVILPYSELSKSGGSVSRKIKPEDCVSVPHSHDVVVYEIVLT